MHIFFSVLPDIIIKFVKREQLEKDVSSVDFLDKDRFSYLDIFWSFMYILANICDRLWRLQNCSARYRTILCDALLGGGTSILEPSFLPDLPSYDGDYLITTNHRGSHRDLPSPKRRSLPPFTTGFILFSPLFRCLDTSTYVYARERMRANNGPACIWNSINSPNISSSSEINLIVPRWKWWHHY